ncbi:MAG: adenylyltransferase/cytidyltransferase family protein [Minisyncoccales bacterium]|jgi:rfaE bifunctional protein nucleotidyltransferase chain/domain
MNQKEINDFFSHETNFDKRFIPNYDDLEKVIFLLKKNNKKIVLTQGVWDLIHEGHAKYLEKAKSYGDILIVGVDSDQLTKNRKGPNRPIVPQNERIRMLIHLRHVDIVTIREADQEIGDLIRLVSPDVLITSKSTTDFTSKMKRDYKDFCKEILTLTPQATTSTTARIRDLAIEGAEDLAREVRQITDDFLKRLKERR